MAVAMQRFLLLLLSLAFAGGSAFPARALYRCAMTAQSVCCCGPNPSCRAAAGAVRAKSSAPRFERVCCSLTHEMRLAAATASFAAAEGGWKKVLDDGRVPAGFLPRAVLRPLAAPRERALTTAGGRPHAPPVARFLAHCAFLI